MSRQERVGEAIREEISLIIQNKLKDPRLGFITITRVEMTNDLRIAKVYYSVLGSAEEYKKTEDALESGLGVIRSMVAQRVNLRFAPEIIFRSDRSSEYSVRIQEVLDEIKAMEASERAAKIVPRKTPKRKGSRNVPKKSRRRAKKTR